MSDKQNKQNKPKKSKPEQLESKPKGPVLDAITGIIETVAEHTDNPVVDAIQDMVKPPVYNIDPEVVEIVKQLKSYLNLNPKNMSIADIPPLVIKTMELVENLRDLSGDEKKDLVIEVVKTVVDDTDMTGSFEPIILPMLPVLIDQLVMVADGKMKINTGLKAKVTGCFVSVKTLFTNCKCCKKTQ
jgi:hypothetical protein